MLYFCLEELEEWDNQVLLAQIAEMMEEVTEKQTHKIETLIETKITKRIDALTDGYKSVHEKQWELERQNEQLMAVVNDLQNRVAVLESKTA